MLGFIIVNLQQILLQPRQGLCQEGQPVMNRTQTNFAIIHRYIILTFNLDLDVLADQEIAPSQQLVIST